jgi:hypothetical protein
VPDVVSLRRVELVQVLFRIGLVGDHRNARRRPSHKNSEDLPCMCIRRVLPSRFPGRWRDGGAFQVATARKIAAERTVFVGRCVVQGRAIVGAVRTGLASRWQRRRAAACRTEGFVPVRQILNCVDGLTIENLELRQMEVNRMAVCVPRCALATCRETPSYGTRPTDRPCAPPSHAIPVRYRRSSAFVALLRSLGRQPLS